MRVATVAKALLPLWLVAGLVVANCTISSNMGSGQFDPNEETVAPGCDPDGFAPCPDYWYICTDTDVGGKLCESDDNATPTDGGGWSCEVQGTTLVCTGTEMPGDGDWVCEDNGDGTVTCMGNLVPPAGDDMDWDCWYEGSSLVCSGVPGDGGGDGGDADGDGDIDGGGGDECPPGVEIPTAEICDGVDNDCDGTVDEDCGEPPPDDCLCIPGTWRYCDTPTYCRWGMQHCRDDGLEWGPCSEIGSIPAACAHIDGWYSPAASACCVEQGMCCQDMWDLDHDGDTWESLGDCTDILCV